jgi:SHS2 domain-containing protein
MEEPLVAEYDGSWKETPLSPESYRFFDHDADVGIYVRAESEEDLFRAAARAMMDWIGPAPTARSRNEVNLDVTSDDREGLLVRWLQELIYLFHTGRFYVDQIRDVVIEENRIRAVAVGSCWEEESRSEYREVKAVTYHRLRVSCENGVWEATVILDV